MIAPVDFETLSTPLAAADWGASCLVSLDTDLAKQHRHRRQVALGEMAETQVTLTSTGLYIAAPNRHQCEPDDARSQSFAQMPAAFARDYLQLRLRNFLYDTFCRTDCRADEVSPTVETDAAPSVLINDRLGGGLHTGLLEQFQQSNRGTGFFDSGWVVLQTEADGTVAVEKEGVVVHAEASEIESGDRLRPLSVHKQSISPHALRHQEERASPQEVSIKLPGHRFESDMYSSAYVAIGNLGPVPDHVQAVELYLAAFPAAMAPVMAAITTALNREQAVPYTLKVPYRPEDYRGPEAIALRIPKAAFVPVLPLIEQIWQQHLASQNLASQNLDQALKLQKTQQRLRSPWLRPELPLFAEALWPGISAADVIQSTATQWFGSSADLSRTEQVAAALVQQFYSSS